MGKGQRNYEEKTRGENEKPPKRQLADFHEGQAKKPNWGPAPNRAPPLEAAPMAGPVSYFANPTPADREAETFILEETPYMINYNNETEARNLEQWPFITDL